jgi:hypothetical protein
VQLLAMLIAADVPLFYILLIIAGKQQSKFLLSPCKDNLAPDLICS